MNIVEPILFQARNRPSELALAAPGSALNLVSYARLVAMLSEVVRRLRQYNLREGDYVTLEIDDPLLLSIFALALARLGVVILTSLDRDYAWPLEVTAVISSGVGSSDRHILVDYNWVLGQQSDENKIPDVRGHTDEPRSFCCIFAERGPASGHCCFGISHRLLSARIGIQDVFFGSACAGAPRVFTSESPATSLGFQLLVATLSRGAALFLSSDQASSFNALDIYQIESVVLSPKCLLDLITFHDLAGNSPCNLKNVFIVGRVSKATADRAANILGANLSIGFYDTYLGPVASMPWQNSGRPENAVGFLLPGIYCDALNNGTLHFRSEFSAEILEKERQTDSLSIHLYKHGSLTPDLMLLLDA